MPTWPTWIVLNLHPSGTGLVHFSLGESLSCLAKISPSEGGINWLTTYFYLAFVEGVMKLQHLTFFWEDQNNMVVIS